MEHTIVAMRVSRWKRYTTGAVPWNTQAVPVAPLFYCFPRHTAEPLPVVHLWFQVGSAVLLLSRFIGLEWNTSEAVRLAEERSALTSDAVNRLSEDVGNLEQRLVVAQEPKSKDKGGETSETVSRNRGDISTSSAPCQQSSAAENRGAEGHAREQRRTSEDRDTGALNLDDQNVPSPRSEDRRSSRPAPSSGLSLPPLVRLQEMSSGAGDPITPSVLFVQEDPASKSQQSAHVDSGDVVSSNGAFVDEGTALLSEKAAPRPGVDTPAVGDVALNMEQSRPEGNGEDAERAKTTSNEKNRLGTMPYARKGTANPSPDATLRGVAEGRAVQTTTSARSEGDTLGSRRTSGDSEEVVVECAAVGSDRRRGSGSRPQEKGRAP